MAAAQVLSRTAYGIEISPSYCDVILQRIAHLSSEEPRLAATGSSLATVAAARGVPWELGGKPRAQDPRRIQHHGPAPFYGSRGSRESQANQ